MNDKAPVYVPPTPQEVREGAWAVLKNSKALNAAGHARAVRWARGWLGMDPK